MISLMKVFPLFGGQGGPHQTDTTNKGCIGHYLQKI